MRSAILALTVIVLAGTVVPPAHAQKNKAEDPFVERVKRGIDKGVAFLKREQQNEGHWETKLEGIAMPGGMTSLALLALLNALGQDGPKDRDVIRGLEYLRKLEPEHVYVRALQTMVYAEAGDPKDRQRIIDNVAWLLKARQMKDGRLLGWSYTMQQKAVADGSNDQYAVLGLVAGRQGGARIPPEAWEKIRDLYLGRQRADGHWDYSERGNPFAEHGDSAKLTMTQAGVCNLLIAAMELNAGCDSLIKDPRARKCGTYQEDPAIKAGLSWMTTGKRFQLDPPHRTFYSLYGMERVGRFTGNRFLGPYDWYRECSKFLVDKQHADGSWSAVGAWDRWPVVSTSFALLVLSKGRTPILISKLVHTPGGWPRKDDSDWNNDRNDLRNLVEFARFKMFKNVPLGWQTFDIQRAAEATDEAEVTGELLASPIAYFNGHFSPLLRFTETEKKILKRFVDNGGFIFVEACCGDKRFDEGFKKLVAEMWPGTKLAPLEGGHPVWTSHFKVTPKRASMLMGLEVGCKTVLIYSPQDLSCAWESNRLDNELVKEAFELGCNIIHYATGLELPDPRGTIKAVSGPPPKAGKRGFFRVGQLRGHLPGNNAKPAPRAMTNLLSHLRTFAGLDVEKVEDVPVLGESTIDYKFLYMHGRGEIPQFLDADLANLRLNLENGGLLLADACCGNPPFDQSFRKFVQAVFPPAKYPDAKLRRIPPSDFLFSKEVNSVPLTRANIRCRTEKSGPLNAIEPYLEGIKIDNRWVVIYSKYDLGCALEKHRSGDCVGYDTDSAFKLAGAAVLYMLKLKSD